MADFKCFSFKYAAISEKMPGCGIKDPRAGKPGLIGLSQAGATLL